MPTPRHLRPFTNEQAVQLRRDLTLAEERLRDITILMRLCYGDVQAGVRYRRQKDSQVVVRADEASAALQRLKWELERTKVRKRDLQVEEGCSKAEAASPRY